MQRCVKLTLIIMKKWTFFWTKYRYYLDKLALEYFKGIRHTHYTISYKDTTEKYFLLTFRKIYAIALTDPSYKWKLLIYDGYSWTKYNFDLFTTGIAGRLESSTGGPQILLFLRPQGTVLFREWFSTKIVIYDFWIFKVPFFCSISSYFNFWN